MHIHIHNHIKIHTCTYTHTHIYENTHAHTHTHTHTHKHTHIHTRTQTVSRERICGIREKLHFRGKKVQCSEKSISSNRHLLQTFGENFWRHTLFCCNLSYAI